jgi:hypothetical protein
MHLNECYCDCVVAHFHFRFVFALNIFSPIDFFKPLIDVTLDPKSDPNLAELLDHIRVIAPSTKAGFVSSRYFR